MEPSSELAGLVNQMPNLDSSGKLTGPDPAAAKKIFDAVLSGGRDRIIQLVDMIAEPDVGGDHKVRYLLHGLAVYVGRPNAEDKQKLFTESLVSTLGGDRSKAAQAFVIRQLQVAGGRKAVAALGKLLLDQQLCEFAAQAMLAINDGAAEQFRAALPKARGNNRLTIIQALGVLRDGTSIEALKKAVGDKDRETRLAAGWALANVGQRDCVDLLLDAADSEGYERIQATKACLLLAENLAARGQKTDAARIYKHLRDTRTEDSEQYVRQVAERGLATVN